MFSNLEFGITREYILSKVTEEDIFLKYLGLVPNDRGLYINPLRKDDESPGCSFYIDSRGRWKFKDFAGGFNWDCFNVVEYDFNCSFKEALIKVAIDFNLMDGKKSNIVFTKRKAEERVVTGIRVKRRAWYKEDIDYWAQFGVTEEILNRGNVSPISHAWFTDNGVLRPSCCYYYTKGDPAYVYHFGDYTYKIYLPFRGKGIKFIQGSSYLTIQGLDLLPAKGASNLLITKSYKDVLSLFAFSHKFDLYSVAPMSETILISLESFTDLYNRFDNISTLFDFDKTGIALMRKYQKEYKLPFLSFGKKLKGEGIKDFSDYRRIKGEQQTCSLIEQFLQPLY